MNILHPLLSKFYKFCEDSYCNLEWRPAWDRLHLDMTAPGITGRYPTEIIMGGGMNDGRRASRNTSRTTKVCPDQVLLFHHKRRLKNNTDLSRREIVKERRRRRECSLDRKLNGEGLYCLSLLLSKDNGEVITD